MYVQTEFHCIDFSLKLTQTGKNWRFLPTVRITQNWQPVKFVLGWQLKSTWKIGQAARSYTCLKFEVMEKNPSWSRALPDAIFTISRWKLWNIDAVFFFLFNSWSSLECSGAKSSCLTNFDVMALFVWAGSSRFVAKPESGLIIRDELFSFHVFARSSCHGNASSWPKNVRFRCSQDDYYNVTHRGFVLALWHVRESESNAVFLSRGHRLFVLRPSKVRKLVRTNQFQVKSTKIGTVRKFVTLQYQLKYFQSSYVKLMQVFGTVGALPKSLAFYGA